MKLEKHDLNNRQAYWWIRSANSNYINDVGYVDYYGYVNHSHCLQSFAKFPVCIAV